jgi:hypothetical protein
MQYIVSHGLKTEAVQIVVGAAVLLGMQVR